MGRMWREESWPISVFVALFWVETLTELRTKKKISVLVTSVWGPDFNIRHPEKEEEIWLH